MQYLISFLEGIITFISPCLLPMLPIYVSYFAGGENKDNRKTLLGAVGFSIGFTIVFVSMGALAGTIGSFLIAHQNAVNIISGIIIIIFGLNYLGLFRIPFPGRKGTSFKFDNMNFLTLVVFGMIFSLGWTPCVGAFLGSALILASQQGEALTGMFMLLCYSLGLAIPFIISAVLIQKLKGTFNFIKAHYQVINTICGAFLILVGILMATGTLGRILVLFS